MWGLLGLSRCNPNKKILETSGVDPIRAAFTTLVKADDNSIRLIGRVSLAISDDYLEVPRKFWQNALELDDVALPAAFKVK